MRKKFISGVLALIGLGSMAVLGGSPQIMGGLIEYIQNSAVGNALFSGNGYQYYGSGGGSVENVPSFLKTNENVNLKTEEIPEEILWRVILGFPEKFNALAENARAAGQNETLYTEYFTRQANLSVENAEIFKQKAAEYAAALRPVTERMQSIGNYRRAARERSKKLPHEEVYALKKELLELQEKQKEITLKYRDEFRNAIDVDSFASFENWLKTEFAAKFSSKKITSKDMPSKNSPNSNRPNKGFELTEKITKEDNRK